MSEVPSPRIAFSRSGPPAAPDTADRFHLSRADSGPVTIGGGSRTWRDPGTPGSVDSDDQTVRAPRERPLSQQIRDGLIFGVNFTVAAVALVVLLPVMLLIAVAIKLDSPGPVIFRQLRVGRDRRADRTERSGGRRSDDLGGRPFFIYKFRTMKVDAEQETGPVWADREDDRCTRVGRVLRRYRLDELPQLWNVLRGEMSVVGPRPERPGHVRMLRRQIEEYPERQRVRPGITGWAQINQESDSSVDDVRRKIRYDIEYLRQRSVLFDVEIMLRTPVVMIGKANSHETADDEDEGTGGS